jgi:hypothetical protein
MKFGLVYEMETPGPSHALSEYNTCVTFSY